MTNIWLKRSGEKHQNFLQSGHMNNAFNTQGLVWWKESVIWLNDNACFHVAQIFQKLNRLKIETANSPSFSFMDCLVSFLVKHLDHFLSENVFATQNQTEEAFDEISNILNEEEIDNLLPIKRWSGNIFNDKITVYFAEINQKFQAEQLKINYTLSALKSNFFFLYKFLLSLVNTFRI